MTNPNIDSGTIIWEVPYSAPNTLYYVSQNTPGMSGQITVSNLGPQGIQGIQGIQGNQGITGPTGPTGFFEILGTYETEQELLAAHPTAVEGKAAFVSGVFYVWNPTGALWEETENLNGPQGVPGESRAANLVVNSAFDVWQRGVTGNMNTAPYYGPDRWQVWRTGSVAGGTWTRVPTTVAGLTYACRVQRDSASSDLSDLNLATSFQSIDVGMVAGDYTTLSFWARGGTAFSPTSRRITASLLSGNGTDGNINSELTNQTSEAEITVALTTSWQRFSITTSFPLSEFVTQLGVLFSATPTGTASTTDWFEVTGVQVEAGEVAQNFIRNKTTASQELEECQKYYYKSDATFWGGNFSGNVTSGSAYYAFYKFPLTMRGTPAITLTNVSALSFPSTVGSTSQISTNGFAESRLANATANGGFFGSSYVANAEL
jgi:hypothetical protein